MEMNGPVLRGGVAVRTTRLLMVMVTLAAPMYWAHGWGAEKVLMVCDETAQMEVLGKFLREEGGYEVQIVGQDDLPNDVSGYCGIFNFVHRPLTEEVEEALIGYALAGGRLITLHHGISSSKMLNKKWLPFSGVALFRKGRDEGGWSVLGNVTAELVNLHPRHYITSHKVIYEGTTAYTPSDSPSTEQQCGVLRFPRSEVFLNEHFTDGREKTVLFGVKGQDPETGRVYMQDRGGWYQPKGKGWVFYFQIGHATSDFQKRSYCQILLNCLTWDERKGGGQRAR
jgi:hypothetical protein